MSVHFTGYWGGEPLVGRRRFAVNKLYIKLRLMIAHRRRAEMRAL